MCIYECAAYFFFSFSSFFFSNIAKIWCQLLWFFFALLHFRLLYFITLSSLVIKRMLWLRLLLKLHRYNTVRNHSHNNLFEHPFSKSEKNSSRMYTVLFTETTSRKVVVTCCLFNSLQILGKPYGLTLKTFLITNTHKVIWRHYCTRKMVQPTRGFAFQLIEFVLSFSKKQLWKVVTKHACRRPCLYPKQRGRSERLVKSITTVNIGSVCNSNPQNVTRKR